MSGDEWIEQVGTAVSARTHATDALLAALDTWTKAETTADGVRGLAAPGGLDHHAAAEVAQLQTALADTSYRDRVLNRMNGLGFEASYPA